MPDMLVKLYNLPTLESALERPAAAGFEIRQARPAEKHRIAEWVGRHFAAGWSAECEVTIEQRPVTCYIAIKKAPKTSDDPYDIPEEKLVGFACYDATRKGMFGPTGVDEKYRQHGVGKALLIACLHAMLYDGYAYAVIGWAGPSEFYAKAVGATVIEGSEPGIYRGPLKVD